MSSTTHARQPDRDDQRRINGERVVHEAMIDDRAVGDYVRAYPGPGEPTPPAGRHTHCTDRIVGYVIRVTRTPGGQTLWRDHTGAPATEQQYPGRCGYDADVVSGPVATAYPEAKARAVRHHIDSGQTMIDSLFACGCRI